MSIYLYEEAIVERLREITGDDRIIITPSDNIINVIPRIAKDELKLPLIHMTRLSTSLTSKNPHGMKMNGHVNNEFPLYRNGDNISCEDGRVHRVHAIPFTFTHAYEVWSKTRRENVELIRELIWFFSTMGEFIVKIPYGLNMEHVFTLQLNNDISDGTNVVSHKDAGELFLQTITCTCNDAYFWKSSSHNPTCIHIDAQINNFVEVEKTIDYNKKLE